ncbi:MAG: phenylalanine 4-monooxygenase [Phycisphaerales bacterium]|nr:phenylalanine 4-monooxygenase [Phycisphaerales bacterium]
MSHSDKMLRFNKIIVGSEATEAQAAADAAANLPADQIDPEKFFIPQQYERYTPENHEVWRKLFENRIGSMRQQASNVFLAGFDAFGLKADAMPRLEDVNEVLARTTGWKSRAVPGYLPAKAFFACLSTRQFPTTITIRPPDELDYLPEPDIFHDVFGHVPLHADPVFADFLQTYGKAALHANDPVHVERLARLFWFTVEFGLIHEDNRLKIYGSGLMSSIGESTHSLSSPNVDRRPFNLERVCDTPFEIDHYQPILYVLESFEQLRDAMNQYAERVLDEVGVGAGA